MKRIIEIVKGAFSSSAKVDPEKMASHAFQYKS